MSDAVRSYGGRKRSSSATRRVRGRGRGIGGGILLGALAVVLIYSLWITRDSHDVAGLVPARRSYHVVTKDVFAKRVRLAQSQVWKALPPEFGVSDIPAKLSQNVGVPQWILNNLVPGACYVTGNDVHSFTDLLMVTRMTRVGTLLEKFRTFIPDLQEDYAGGLNLCRVGNLYYAVRGRVLLLSLSRPGLVEALTLLPEEALSAESLDGITQALGSEDIYGSFYLAQNDPMGKAVESGKFSVRIDQTAASVTCQTVLRPEWRAQMAHLLDGVTPQALQAPPDGMLKASINLNKPVAELWKLAGMAAGKQEAMDALWTKWSTSTTPEGAPGLAQSVVGLLGPLGPGLRLAWTGIDLNEIIPAPLLVATLDAHGDQISETFKLLPPPPEGSQPWDMYPRYDEEAKVVRLPMMGGASIEPTAGMMGNSLLVSSSRTMAESLLASPPATEPLPKPANLYISLRPSECGKSAFDAAMLFAQAGFLYGYTPETLQQKYGTWLENAAEVQEVTALAGYENGQVALEFGMSCSAQVK